MIAARKKTARAELPQVAVDAVVEGAGWPSPAKLRRLARTAIAAAAPPARRKLAAGSEVAVVFSDDRRVRSLNRKYRGKDKATNVLSFPAAPPGDSYGPLLGDIILAAGVVSAEAAERHTSLDHYIIHLIVHGFLHLLGYDHEQGDEALAMERLETAILGGLGIADPYAE